MCTKGLKMILHCPVSIWQVLFNDPKASHIQLLHPYKILKMGNIIWEN